MDKAIFEELGLTNYEAEIYLSLLENGPCSVYEIATKTGLYRQACYDALNRLEEKAFVSHTLRDGKKAYQSLGPQNVVSILESQKDRFLQIMPTLLRLQSASKGETSVEVFRGKNIDQIALRDIILTMKNSKGEVLCSAVDESIPFAKNKTIVEQYERDLVKYKIKERVIVKEGCNGLLKRGQTSYRCIPEKYFNSNPVQVYADKVQIILWGNPIHLIIIASKDIAESFRKQFELMWIICKKIR